MAELTMKQISQRQKQAGRAHWFGKAEMRFFDSRVEAGPFHNPGAHPTLHYFVTSEQCHFSDGSSAPRKYSVRYWDENDPGRVHTWGQFQQFRTLAAAVRVAEALGTVGRASASDLDEGQDQ